MKKTLFLTLLIMLIIGITVSALSIGSHTIGPLSDTKPSTEDELICSWTPGSDTIEQNVTWWNGTTLHSGPTIIPFTQNQTTLSSYIAQKGEQWTCEVTLNNGTDTQSYNTSITIKNALPTPPNATNVTLFEDQTSIFTIGSTDSDNDTLFYYKLGSDPTYCSVVAATGVVTCLPDVDDIGFVNVTYFSDDGGSYFARVNATYTIQSVNDPPNITTENQTATEGEAFYYNITITDEENHFPINFTYSSNFSFINITNVTNNTLQVSINRTNSIPLNQDEGIYYIVINITDNGPSNNTIYDNPNATTNFTLNITGVNQAPNITTNLSSLNITGTQTGSLLLYVNATDLDVGDTLTFDISTTCTQDNPWSISTVNSSYDNGTGLVNITTLNNTHVICQTVNISVSDSELIDYQEFTVNITNTNDQPEIHTLSFSSNNTDGNTNITNLTAVLGSTFIYQVNASDVDALTYEGETINYSDNSSNGITINTTTGIVSFLPNSSHIGNHSILINVSDDEGNWTNTTLFLTVENNTAPTLQSIGNQSCVEDTFCQINITGIDPDAGEDLVFTSSNATVFPIIDINETTWQLNTTLTNSEVGTYNITITVTDRFSFSDNETFVFTVNNTNDAPFFDQDNNGTNDSVTFSPAVENFTFSQRINVTDDDVAIGFDTLSYGFNFTTDPNSLSTIFNITEEGADYFIISFIPNSTYIGDYQVNISVIDTASALYWQLVNFSVVSPSTDPTVNEIMPYYNNSINDTVFNLFNSTSVFSDNTANVNVTENSTITFDALVVNDSSFTDNTLDYYWYVNGTLTSTLSAVTPGSNSAYDHAFDFFSSGTQNITLTAEDSRFSNVTWSWIVNVSNLNRVPTFSNELPNISVNGTTTLSDYMSHTFTSGNWTQLFYDPDDDLNSDGERGETTGETTSLTYSITTGYSCSIASFSFSEDSITVTPSEVGSCTIRFTATDPDGAAVNASSDVFITVSQIATQEVQTTTSGGSSSGSSSRTTPFPVTRPEDIPQPIDLLVPEEIITRSNESLDIRVTIENTWDGPIQSISLNATTANSTVSPIFSFSSDFIPSLEEEESVETTLTVTNYRQDEPLSIIVSANVGDPSFTDSATVIISSLEQSSSGDDIESKITFAQDLLNENPECQELNELLVQAERERVQGNPTQSLKLINSVVNGCKYIINEQQEPVEEQPRNFFALMTITPKQTPALLAGAAIVAILFVFGILMILSGRGVNKDI